MSEKNIFDYATKELSQDAFLRWFFESYEDPNVGNAVFAFLKEFCGLELTIDDIVSIKTEAQWKHIDVHVMIKTKQQREYDIFIEDKVFSGEHNQLEGYNDDIDKYLKRNDCIIKLFYKLAILGNDELDRVNNAGWRSIDIEAIHIFFNKYDSTKSYLLKQYIEHVQRVNELFSNKKRPDDSDDYQNLIRWQAYFIKAIVPKIETQYRDRVNWVAEIGVYGYAYLYIKRKSDSKAPYLEIRSRECHNGKFRAMILCYGIDESVLKAKQPALIAEIEKDTVFKKSKLYHKNGKNPKQIGETELIEETDENINKCIEHYLKVMEAWK